MGMCLGARHTDAHMEPSEGAWKSPQWARIRCLRWLPWCPPSGCASASAKRGASGETPLLSVSSCLSCGLHANAQCSVALENSLLAVSIQVESRTHCETCSVESPPSMYVHVKDTTAFEEASLMCLAAGWPSALFRFEVLCSSVCVN